MLKQIGFFLVVGVFVLGVATPSANAAVDMSAALKRMDAIIVEMQSLRAEFAKLSGQASTPVASVLGAQTSNPVLTLPLMFGETNDDIALVQKLLATDSEIYPYGLATGFFGPKTEEAIRQFQTRFNLEPVGVVGPSTKALLEVFMAKYPDGNFPDGVLASIPQVAGASTTRTPVVPTPDPVVPTPVVSSDSIIKSMDVDEDDDEYIVRVTFTTSRRDATIIIAADDEEELVEKIAQKLDLSESDVEDALDIKIKSSSSSSRNSDAGDAGDAIESADDAINEARKAKRAAEKDGDDVDDADELYDEARDAYKEAKIAFDEEEYEEAVELAEEAEELAEDSIDELDNPSSSSDSEDVDTIEVDVRDDDAKVIVEYDDGETDSFFVEDTDKDDIIREIADELDIDEDEVEDLVEFDYGDIEEISAEIDDGETDVVADFESGLRLRFTVDEDDEDDVIDAIAELLEVRSGVIEDIIEFD